MILQTRLLSVAVVAALALPASAIAATPAQSAAATRALGLIDGHAPSVKRADADRFIAKDTIIDSNGTEHVRFDRTYRGLAVLGGDVVVHSRNGQFKSASLTLKTTGRPDITPTISADRAIVEAGTRFGTGFTGTPTSRLVIYARGASPVLAHEVTFSGVKADQTPTDMHYIVDARSGGILDKWDTIETARPGGGGHGGGGGGSTCSTTSSGTGKTIYSGNVAIGTAGCTDGTFQMKDLSRGGTYTTDFNNGATSKPGTGTIFSDADNVWGNNSNSDRASAGADAHFGVATTWDFYKGLGRNGIANDGKGSYSRVHVGNNYVNAFWSDSCFCMSYGDGDGVTYSPLVDLDVAGHEMSHGVTSRTANLTYSGESGGLNEGTSDIMGSMVEFFANNANDTPDYLIGEEIYINNTTGKALRYMFSPNKDGSSADCWYSGVGSLDVHYSSGPANHFFYLLAEGTGAKTFSGINHTPTTCKAGDTKKGTGSVSLAGIGRDAATKIWYRALTTYMTSSTDYAGARVATLNAAADLFGAGSANYNAVAATWSAILVN
jgi:Zn-dependent metalloprotease